MTVALLYRPGDKARVTDVLRPAPAQYLRDDAIRGGMDLLLFAHKSHLQRADAELDALGLGRAHHRLLYFVARQPDVTMGELLAVLQVTKQSLNRVLRTLVAGGYVEQRTGERDRRQRLVRLTPQGQELEHKLFLDLRANMERAYMEAGENAVHGFWVLMQHLMTPEARRHFNRFQELSAGSR